MHKFITPQTYKPILSFALFVLYASLSWGQSIFTNPITGTNPNTSNPYTTGQTVDANITVSGIGRGTGIAGSNANDRYNASGWSTGAIDLNDYFTFTLTPSLGYEIDFVSLVYTSQASGTGPTNFAVRSSIDGFSSNIATPAVGGATIDLSAASYQNITTAITFRVYGFNAGAAGGTFSINDFTFNGNVNLVAACTAPTTQASAINVTNINSTSATINWTNGNGNNRIVVVKQGSAVAGNPVSNTAYTANATFGSGATIAANEYVVYNGNGNSVNITGLNCNATYHIKVFEYNNAGICYLTTSVPSGNFTTTTPSLTQQVAPSLNTFTYAVGSGPSVSQTRLYSASNLAPSSGSVRITTNSTPIRYEVSLDDNTFADFVDINYTGGAFTNIPIYIRLKSGLAVGNYSTHLKATVQSVPSGCSALSDSLAISGVVTALPCSQLFISEYIEGLSNDKAIEIYNPTANPINLTGYFIRIYSNGNTNPSYEATLTGTIPAYGTWVAANASASATILAKTGAGLGQTFPSASFNFDGNDAIALELGTPHGTATKIDIFGRIGENPGGGKWVSGSIETNEQTLVRKPNVQVGVGANPTSGFPTLSTEWLPYTQSESSLLGTHFSTCNNTNVVIPSVISPTQYCVTSAEGDDININFTTVGTFNAGNAFQAQLSDATGSFASPVTIGSLDLSGANVSGTINGTIPAGTLAGTEYRIRVTATQPDGLVGPYISPTKVIVNVGPVNPTVVTATTSGSGNAQLSWSNPICLDEMLVIVCTDAPVATVPFGDGSNYSTVSSTECLINACEQVVYKGTGSSITLNSLEDGKTYYFKVFTRMGSLWSSGVSANVTPNGATTIQPGDFAVIGVNANNGSCEAGTGDSIYFVCFKDIQSGTTIDITDDGYERVNAGQFGNTEGFYRVTYTGATIPAGQLITWYFPNSGVPATLATGWAVTNLGSTSGFNFNSGGDQMFFLQGGTYNFGTANTHNATYTGGRYLFAFNTNNTWSAANNTQNSNLPTQATCYAQQPSSGTTNYMLYTGTTSTTDKYTWLQRLLNTANWSTYTACADFNSALNANFATRNISIDNTNPAVLWTGTASTNWFECSNWSSNLVPDANVNVTIPNTANKPNINVTAPFSDQYQDVAACKNLIIQNGAILTVEGNVNNRLDIFGNLTINSGGILDADDGTPSADGTIRVSGNWINNNGVSGFLEGNSTVKFFGNLNQIIDINTGTESFHNLTIEKQNQTYLELNDDDVLLSSTGVLEFSCGGILRTNNNKITISNPARTTAIIGFDIPNGTGTYTNDKYVFGNLERNINTTGEYTFPVGDIHTGEAYNPIRIDIQSGSGMATAKFVAGNPGSIVVPFTTVICGGQPKFVHYTGMTGQGWWNMSSSTSTTFGYTVYLHPNLLNANTFPNDDAAGGYKNNYRALKATTGTAGGVWPPASGFDGDACTVSNNYYEIIGVGYSGFSDFAPGGGSGNTTALPVELISFTSTCIDDNEIQLNWVTATEVNSDYFQVEKSNDAIHFEPIATVQAQGSSQSITNYNYSIFSNILNSYYRLKQFDIDGKVQTFNMIYTNCEKNNADLNIYYAGNNQIRMDVNTSSNNEYVLNLFQYDGKFLFSKKVVVEKGSQSILIPLGANLSKGLYIIQLQNNTTAIVKKLLID